MDLCDPSETNVVAQVVGNIRAEGVFLLGPEAAERMLNEDGIVHVYTSSALVRLRRVLSAGGISELLTLELWLSLITSTAFLACLRSLSRCRMRKAKSPTVLRSNSCVQSLCKRSLVAILVDRPLVQSVSLQADIGRQQRRCFCSPGPKRIDDGRRCRPGYA